MTIVYGIIIAASLGIAYQALGGRAIFHFREHPAQVIGARLRLLVDEGLEQLEEELPGVTVETFTGNTYRGVFDRPFQYGGRQQRLVRFHARHAGYPVSHVGRRRLLAVNGELEGGEQFIGRIARV